MGWFSSPSTKSSTPKPTSDGAFEAPNKSYRALCYEARDAFFRCLDENNILDSIKDKDAANKACGNFHQEFESSCASSWVKYFKERRVADYRKEQTIKRIEAEGGDALPPLTPRSR